MRKIKVRIASAINNAVATVDSALVLLHRAASANFGFAREAA